MLVAKIIKIRPLGPHLALRASKQQYSIAKTAKTSDPFLTIELPSRCLGNHSKRQVMLETKFIKIRVHSGKSLFPNICALLLLFFLAEMGKIVCCGRPESSSSIRIRPCGYALSEVEISTLSQTGQKIEMANEVCVYCKINNLHAVNDWCFL